MAVDQFGGLIQGIIGQCITFRLFDKCVEPIDDFDSRILAGEVAQDHIPDDITFLAGSRDGLLSELRCKIVMAETGDRVPYSASSFLSSRTYR